MMPLDLQQTLLLLRHGQLKFKMKAYKADVQEWYCKCYAFLLQATETD